MSLMDRFTPTERIAWILAAFRLLTFKVPTP